MNKITTIVVIFILLLQGACKREKYKMPHDVVIWALGDPQMLNPINSTDALASYIVSHIFESLLVTDHKTLEISPYLADSLPIIEKIKQGDKEKMLITYRIRPEATWDDGTPITAKDIEFSLKVIKCPGVDNEHLKPYYDFLEDVILYEDNPKKITFVCSYVYIEAINYTGDVPVLDKRVFDPQGILDGYSIKDFCDSSKIEKIKHDPRISNFAQWFNSERFQNDTAYIKGTGPYRFVQWIRGKHIILERKKNWWGDRVSKKTTVWFENYPPRIIYRIVKDVNAAIVELKKENIDLMEILMGKDFLDLLKNEKFMAKFNVDTLPTFAYTYIGINMKNPILSDKRIRKAFAHIVNVNEFINLIEYGFAEPVCSPISKLKTKFYNFDLSPYKYDLGEANKLLKEAGCEDRDGDGILEITKGNVVLPLVFTIKYNAENQKRANIAKIFKEEAKKIGVKIEILPREWSVFLDELKKHDFDFYIGAWISTPTSEDYKQIWHTSSYNGGSNYVGFGNEITDKIIEDIRREIDEQKRIVLHKRLQAIIHDEVPYIFLYTVKNKLTYHKRFEGVVTSALRPGYWAGSFKYMGQ